MIFSGEFWGGLWIFASLLVQIFSIHVLEAQNSRQFLHWLPFLPSGSHVCQRFVFFSCDLLRFADGTFFALLQKILIFFLCKKQRNPQQVYSGGVCILSVGLSKFQSFAVKSAMLGCKFSPLLLSDIFVYSSLWSTKTLAYFQGVTFSPSLFLGLRHLFGCSVVNCVSLSTFPSETLCCLPEADGQKHLPISSGRVHSISVCYFCC